MIELIATLPPYVRHRDAIARHPRVDALRFNSIMPIGEPKRDVLAMLQRACGDKRLYVDLKGRQLRITAFAYLPYAFVEISRPITVDLPARVRFKDGEAEIVSIVGGTKLILGERPPRVVGAGEPITILDPSLRIAGYLTEDDRAYVAAARELGLHDYMLSFVEGAEDLDELRALDPEARIVAKIESRAGVAAIPALTGARLMAARDDLLLQMGDARIGILDALARIIDADPSAIAASRVLTSLEPDPGQWREPAKPDPAVSLGDLADLALAHRMGYRAFMLSDGLCFSERAFQRSIEVFAEMAAWLQRR